MSIDIISRKEWGAKAPRNINRVTWNSRTEFVVHYTAGPTTQTIRQIQNFHMDTNGWSDIGYNFLVDNKGRIYEGRGWLVVGAHADGHNRSGIGVCFIGKNDSDVTPAAKNSIKILYDKACDLKGKALRRTGHGLIPGQNTACPGNALRSWVKAGMPSSKPPQEEKMDAATVKKIAEEAAEAVWNHRMRPDDNPKSELWEAESVSRSTRLRTVNIEDKLDKLTDKVDKLVGLLEQVLTSGEDTPRPS